MEGDFYSIILLTSNFLFFFLIFKFIFLFKMDQLSKLGVVSKVCLELENHLGFSDKSLAEFIIHIAEKSATVKEFTKELQENDADFPLPLYEKLYRLIKSLTAPPSTSSSDSSSDYSSKKSKFAALSISNTGVVPLDGMAEEKVFSVAHDREKKLKEEEERLKNLTIKVENDSKNKNDRSKEKDRRDSSRDRDRDRDRRAGSRDRDRRVSSRDRERSRDRGRSRDRERGRSRDRERGSSRDKDRKGSSRDRGNSRDRDRKRKFDSSSEPILHEIYDGKISKVTDFGCFVELDGFSPRREGLVHISQIQTSQSRDLKEKFRRGDRVKVKILSVNDKKLSLSMKEVDQKTGEDLLPQRSQLSSMKSIVKNEDLSEKYGKEFNKNLKLLKDLDRNDENLTQKKKLTSPELFEARQLLAAGIIDSNEFASLYQDGQTEEIIDIEINEEEPVFLRGQTKLSKELSPVRIVKNVDGSLNRAAMHQTELTKERKELKQAQINSIVDSIPKDLSKPWEDPLPQAGERHFASELRSINLIGNNELPEWKQETQGKSLSYGQISNKSIKEQRESLPIYSLKSELCKAIAQNQVLVVIGETGSGKTTQMTQYMAEMGYTKHGIIGCTQPRRVAAMSVAKRVAEEYGCNLGEEVGYTIRFEDCTSPSTVLKFMTDGMLMREYLADQNLSKYIAIMLDEAHERTIHTDVLFGLLKGLLKRRSDFKLIVTSATLDAEKFSRYFFDCPIFTIPGRTYPVEIMYCKEPEEDYLEACMTTVMQIHLTEPAGDILVFLTGQEEIDTCAEVLYSRMKALNDLAPPLIILPAYGALPSEMQSRIFEPAPKGSRKCIIATNIAEASLTIDGIYYVIDPGFCKQKVYNSKLGMDSLIVCPISMASARQRAGRAGRTGPGKCYRLYTEAAYNNEMLPASIPEIQRTNLANVVLQLKAMGINDLNSFDFMDPPPLQTLIGAMESLYHMDALDEEGLLTKLGRKLAEFPLEPALAKMLIISHELKCSEEILTIVAMLSVENPFYRPKDKATQADSKKAKFNHADGDHLTLLNVYNAWKSSKFSNSWCFENFLQPRALKRAQDVRKQLVTVMNRYQMDIYSCLTGSSSEKNLLKVRKCIVAGFFMNTAKKDPTEGYKTVMEGQIVYIHPSSSLHNKGPEWVLYHELVLTTKEYMRNVCAIDPKWLVELAPNFFKRSDPTKLSKAKKAEKIEPLFDRFNPKDAWRLSKRKG